LETNNYLDVNSNSAVNTVFQFFLSTGAE